MSGQLVRNALGPVGQRVVANVRNLRYAHNLTYAELSARLGDAGRPIPTLGLSRLERGSRRVDVDDLVALAQALGVSADDLLFGEVAITVKKEGQS